jgi:biopolymer transport protein TolQ
MIKSLFENGLWQLIEQSDLVSKGVLVLLLFISILCWTVFFYKLILLRLKKKHIATVIGHLKNVKTVDEISTIALTYSHTVPGYLLTQNLRLFKEILMQKNEAKIERVLEQMDIAIEDIIFRQGSYLPLLSTSAAIAPLLGLFGTVWGLIHAFVGISQQQGADIATIAPGIAEALITTLGGLIVAIPAVVLFNYLAMQTSRLEAQFLYFGDMYRFAMERFLL